MAANRSQGIQTFGKEKLLVRKKFCSIAVAQEEGDIIRWRFRLWRRLRQSVLFDVKERQVFHPAAF